MISYSITLHPDGGFDVEVVSINGAHQTMSGFTTLSEADEWIAADKARDSVAGRLEGPFGGGDL
jgi:hypothetical protein